jgi:hypothetical protein
MFFAPPASATKRDLGLVVTSSERDRPAGRENALEWFNAWTDRVDAPWQIKTITIEDGTHAADVTNSYRAGILWLFGRKVKE